ncbi:MAG: glycosyltransferase [Chloroflexi bacterium]|nr:glycosyltransferase [Chloroflexota bacterium]
MRGSVPVTQKSLAEYQAVVGEAQIERIQELAAPLRGARVLHLSVSAFGTGVAELLGSLVPLMNDVGLDAQWQVMRISEDFLPVSKALYSGLGGFFVQWTPEMEEVWLSYSLMNARHFNESYDFVVVHDPQPAPLLTHIVQADGKRPAGKWIWHCHLDVTEPLPDIWEALLPFANRYDAVAFTSQRYVREDIRAPYVTVIGPAIDPLSSKNVDISEVTVTSVLERYGLDARRPIICQVSRFDMWNDPLGVIDAYQIAKREVPELQLVLVASMVSEDPEGWSYYERCARRAGEDHDLYLLSALNNIGNTEINVFQRSSSVVVQKSIRRGFGLGIAEALWKGRPVVAGRVGGFPLQVTDGVTGYLVDSVGECAEKVVFLVRHPAIANRMGQAGKEQVRATLPITRCLRNYLELFNSIRKGVDG